ncbi:DUF421 domain-containing protein [Falsiroseomonas sp.]|uniref:DUF421 domain-containing protein n=1 Tax=Falsiroseomonas sp. TaxID=2870721 RepID=UPI0035670DDE
MEWLDGVHALIGREDGAIAWWQMIVRGLLVFAFGLALIRTAGRRAFGRQTPLDVVLAVLIGSNLSRALTGNAPFLATLVATAALVALYWLAVHAAARWHFFGWLVKGDVVQLARSGKVDRRAMRRTGVSDGDLEEAMRRAGLGTLDQVETAVLERSGKISVAGG